MAKFVLALLAAPLLSAGAQRCRDCGPEDTLPRAHVLPAIAVHLGMPQKASAGVGVVLGEDWQRGGHDHSRNVALMVEPGLDAGRASLAYVRHGFGNFGSGFGVEASVLRTWREPWGAKANLTYVGGGIVVWPIMFVGPRVGLYRRVAGNSRDRRWLFAVDLGFGI